MKIPIWNTCLQYHILCLLSWFASPSPSNHFRHLKTRPYQFLFHPDSATAMWCIQRSNSKTPHVCLYLWQTWHRHKDKIYKTVDRWAKHKVSHVYVYIGYFNYSSRFQYQNEKRVAVKTYSVYTATDRSETKSKKELYIS